MTETLDMVETRGTFVWYELMADDAGAAQRFYEKVVGWTGEKAGIEGMDYVMLKAGNRPVAGLMTLPDDVKARGGRAGWIGYVGVDDVDAMAARVKEKGGQVHRAPDDIPGVGRFAVVADPSGAPFVLFRGTPEMEADAPPPPSPMAPGHIGWHELMGGPTEESFAFYSDLFGWKKGEAMDMGPMGVYQLFSAAGPDAIGGMMKRPAEMRGSYWLYYFIVDDFDPAVERVKSAGGQVVNGPMEVPGGAWIIQALDDQGVLFAIVGMRSAA